MKKIRHLLFWLFSLTISSFALWLWVMQFINPFQADLLDFSIFYISLGGWIAGLVAFIIFYFRVSLSNKEIVYTFLAPSIRHGILASLAICGLLLFIMLKVLNIWTAIVYIVIIIGIEFFFQAKT